MEEDFIKPADLFKRRRITKGPSFNASSNNSCPPVSSFMMASSVRTHRPAPVAQSPMKCLSNLTEPSPTKGLPVPDKLMRNPFLQPVKRRLQLGSSPMKRTNREYASSPYRSPVKKSSRMFEMNDEDANLEAPKLKQNHSPSKRHQTPRKTKCFQNDWTLRSKLRINFDTRCKNWSTSSTTTHKRHSGSLMDEDTPSKVNDKTISLEAIKNAATVYQHPYLPWLPLYPRIVYDRVTIGSLNDQDKKHAQLAVSKHPAATKAMLKAWCESLDDLTNLLIDGKCPYFYICSDFNTMLFRRSTGHHDIQAFVAPYSFDFGLNLSKDGIEVQEFSSDDLITNIENTDTNSCSKNSPKIFGRFNGNTNSTSPSKMKRIISSFESNDDDETDEELDDVKDEDEHESSQAFLGTLGITDLTDEVKPVYRSQTVDAATKAKSIGVITGVEDIRKFIRFLQTTKKHTLHTNGEFASIPPTLLSPREFRLSTPQYPEVHTIMGARVKVNNVNQASSTTTSSGIGTPNGSISGAPLTPPDELQSSSCTANNNNNNNNNYTSIQERVLNQSSTFDEGIQDDFSRSFSMTTTTTTTTCSSPSSASKARIINSNPTFGPRSVELRGPILPNAYRKLHKLLVVSDNSDHCCSSKQLDSSCPFERLKFLP